MSATCDKNASEDGTANGSAADEGATSGSVANGSAASGKAANGDAADEGTADEDPADECATSGSAADGGASRIVGVLGGMDPAATAQFLQMVIDTTDAPTDQEHVDVLIYDHASMPDRSAYLKGLSAESPGPLLVQDARMLAEAGCGILAMPCNTAHAFWQEIQDAVDVPLLNMIELAVAACVACGARKVGIMATEGTIRTALYADACAQAGLQCAYPDDEGQRQVDDCIYGCVKAGTLPTEEQMGSLYQTFFDDGCDAVVLGCTELSVAHVRLGLASRFAQVVDPMTELARAVVTWAGKNVRDNA